MPPADAPAHIRPGHRADCDYTSPPQFATATARTRATLELQTAEERLAIEEAVASAVRTGYRGYLTYNLPSARNTTTGDRLNDQPGTDSIVFDSTAPGQTWTGGRTPFSVPMPAVVVSATKAAKATEPAKATKAGEPKTKKATKAKKVPVK